MNQKARNTYPELRSFNLHLALLAILLAFIPACSPSETNFDTASNEYIDISSFFKEEAKRLNKLNASLEKSLNNGSSTEVVMRKNVDWNEELNPFIDINLNKPAYKNGFDIDTIKSEAGKNIIYTAVDPKLELKTVSIDYVGETVQKIVITTKKDNIYYMSQEVLVYESGKSFQINVKNELKAGKPIQFGITGRIITTSP